MKINFKNKKMSSLSKSKSNSSNNSNNDSSSFKSNNFDLNFFNEQNNNENKINPEINSDKEEEDFNTNTITKYSTNEKANYISRNLLYESKNILNLIEENNNNNLFANIPILKFLFNNNNNINNNNSNNNNNNNKINIENFIFEKLSKPKANWIIKTSAIKIIKKIGEGSSSDIFLGLYRGTEIAEKRLHLINKEKNISEFKREVSSFIILNHPYLLIFYGVIVEPEHLSIITEYCPGGNLHELLYKKKHIYLTWKIRKKFLLQIAKGMNYLHKNNPPILHRDLKSLNIFLTNDIKNNNDTANIKIADYGLSIFYDKNKPLMERVGTCHWMAPEVIKCQEYTTKADVYSYGIIIWEICTREMPYDYYDKESILIKVCVKNMRPDLKKIPNDTPDKLKELMIKCWDQDPNKRPSFDYIITFIENIDV